VGVLETILGLLLVGLVVGALARFAVPGPDPLPIWLTIALGLAGALVGGLAAGALGLVPEAAGPVDEEAAASAFGIFFLFAVGGATVLLILFRKLVQRRPITGPEAQRPGLKPRGLRRILTRQPHRYVEETADPEEGWAPAQLQKLVLLRDAGKISEEEYERRKTALVARL
jgi:uncharacterized membrane protein YeaQ/YmgE (transglycosylase-associated protein family)